MQHQQEQAQQAQQGQQAQQQQQVQQHQQQMLPERPGSAQPRAPTPTGFLPTVSYSYIFVVYVLADLCAEANSRIMQVSGSPTDCRQAPASMLSAQHPLSVSVWFQLHSALSR